MKISQLIIVLIVAGLGVAGIKYTLDQQKIMNLLVTAHGGGPLVQDADATGLRKAKSDLSLEAAAMATERADAVKASESARLEMRDHRDRRDDAQSQLERDTDERDSWQAKVTQAEARVAQIKEEYEKAVAHLKNIPDLGDETELVAALENLKAIVKNAKEEQERLTAEHEDKVEVRKAATDKVAREDTELKHVEGIIAKFEENYRKNKDEFPILAVDTRWNFVVFNAGKESNLVAGDTTPILVKRDGNMLTKLRILSVNGNQIIAEFDPTTLPAGVRLQVGDLAFREKPIGS